MKHVPTAREIMAKWFVTLRPEMDIYEALDILIKKRCSGAPVLDENNQTVGLLTDKDCLRVTSNDAYAQLARGNVSDYMSPVKQTVTGDMDMFRVAEVFLECNFTFLPVIENGTPIGRISRQDMLRSIQQFQRQLEAERRTEERELLKKQRPAGIEQIQELMGEHKRENIAALFSSLHGEDQ